MHGSFECLPFSGSPSLPPKRDSTDLALTIPYTDDIPQGHRAALSQGCIHQSAKIANAAPLTGCCLNDSILDIASYSKRTTLGLETPLLSKFSKAVLGPQLSVQ